MEKQEINYPVDHNGRKVKLGDKIKGFGELVCQDGFKIDRTSIVTANIQNGVLYFGNLSASSFSGGFVIVEPKQEAKTATLIMLDKPILVNEEEIQAADFYWKPDLAQVFLAEYTPHKGCKKILAGHEGTKRLTFNLDDWDNKTIGEEFLRMLDRKRNGIHQEPQQFKVEYTETETEIIVTKIL